MVFTAQQLEAMMPDATQLLSDEPEMESSLHYTQLALLVACLEWLWRDQTDFFVGANLTIYFSRQQLRNRDFRGPDFFLVKHTESRPRNAWVVWEEDGRYPDLIIELLSTSTANVDRTLKKDLYQNRFRTPEYFWFDPFNPNDWAGFFLQQGVYQPLSLNAQNQLISQSLGLALQRWQGNYKGIDATWLRWATLEGELLPTPEEQERLRADSESLRAEQAESQLQQTVRNLLAEGMGVEQVARLTGLSVAQVEELSS